LLAADDGAGKSLMQVLSGSKPVGKAQQRFQRLVGKIGSCREQIEKWRNYSIRYNERVLREMAPLRAEFRDAQRKMVVLIDELLRHRSPGERLRKGHRVKLRELLLTLTDDLLAGGADEELDALRARHDDSPAPGIHQAESEALRGILEEALGFELDTAADAGPEELLRQAQRMLDEQLLAGRAHRAPREGPGGKGSAAGAATAARPGTGRTGPTLEAKLSLRDVFRKLASALHPDREPDAEQRRRKTLLMQRVNRAYAADDLLGLLTLQLEIEQIDAAHLSSLPAERLTHYNHVLRDQLQELEAELRRHIEPYRAIMARTGRRTFSPDAVDRQMSADIAVQRAALRELREDLVAFRDPSRLRERLARYEPERAAEPPEELAAFAEFLELAELAQAFGGRRRGKR
jgi:hypothetical protein